MRECERLFGVEPGQRLHEMMESAIDGPCPCLVDELCPLMSALTPSRRPAVTVQLPLQREAVVEYVA